MKNFIHSSKFYKPSVADDAESNVCETCDIHEQGTAAAVFACPHCGSLLDHPDDHYKMFQENRKMVGVGEVNGDDPQWFFAAPTAWCNACHGSIAFLPVPIIYNANHDIFYTGGDYFSALAHWDEGMNATHEEDEATRKHMGDSVANWIDRRAKGENLSMETLTLWLIRDAQQLAARHMAQFIPWVRKGKQAP